jgi:hypothetical protein
MPDGVTNEDLTKRFFAKVYHFTEEMTDEASLNAVTWWPIMEEAESDAEERRMKAESQRASSRGY